MAVHPSLASLLRTTLCIASHQHTVMVTAQATLGGQR